MMAYPSQVHFFRPYPAVSVKLNPCQVQGDRSPKAAATRASQTFLDSSIDLLHILKARTTSRYDLGKGGWLHSRGPGPLW